MPLFSGGLHMVAVLSWWILNVCCCFLHSGWLLFFPSRMLDAGCWMLDGCCYFRVDSAWVLIFLGALYNFEISS